MRHRSDFGHRRLFGTDQGRGSAHFNFVRPGPEETVCWLPALVNHAGGPLKLTSVRILFGRVSRDIDQVAPWLVVRTRICHLTPDMRNESAVSDPLRIDVNDLASDFECSIHDACLLRLRCRTEKASYTHLPTGGRPSIMNCMLQFERCLLYFSGTSC